MMCISTHVWGSGLIFQCYTLTRNKRVKSTKGRKEEEKARKTVQGEHAGMKNIHERDTNIGNVG